MATPSLTATQPSSLTRPAPAARTARPGLGLALGAILLVLAVVPLLGVGLAYIAFSASPVIAPGTRVAGLNLGGVTVEEAVRALDDLWNHDRPMQIVDPPTGRAWPIVAADIGLSVDARRTAEKAYAVGRSGTVVDSVSQAATSLQSGLDINPLVVFDRTQAARTLQHLAIEAGAAMQPAGIEIVGGTVRLVPGRDGRSLNIEATLDLIAADPASMLARYSFVPLIFTTLPASPHAAHAAATEAERLLEIPIRLDVYDPVTDERLTWSPDRPERASWLAVSGRGDEITVRLDEARISDSVKAWSAGLGTERQVDADLATRALQAIYQGEQPSTLIVSYRPTPYLTQGGETLAAIGYRHGFPMWKMEEHNPGINVRAWLAPGTSVVLPPRDSMLLLPVVPDKRIVISISEQHLWAYEGDALRSDHVISTGISRSPTLPGLFQVLSHVENAYASRWDLWMPHFLGIYDALPGFTNGIHGLPLLSSGVRLWGSVLGRPASYGCVILDLRAAEDIYNWADDGVVVEIRR